jgi:hypothetical protein
MYMKQDQETFNLNIFTEDTKHICISTAAAIIIITLFAVSPLSNFFVASLIMKVISMRIMVYILYLNYKQTELLRSATLAAEQAQLKVQLNANIMCSYVFSFFIGLLMIFTFKSIITSIMDFF